MARVSGEGKGFLHVYVRPQRGRAIPPWTRTLPPESDLGGGGGGVWPQGVWHYLLCGWKQTSLQGTWDQTGNDIIPLEET